MTTITQGLIGLFGHSYVDDADHPSGRSIEYQFQIVRRLDGDRHVIQYFSFLDGSPSQLGVMTEAELLGPDVKLYIAAELWSDSYQQQEGQRWKIRKMSPAVDTPVGSSTIPSPELRSKVDKLGKAIVAVIGNAEPDVILHTLGFLLSSVTQITFNMSQREAVAHCAHRLKAYAEDEQAWTRPNTTTEGATL
jgi:hypothetical protein